jgi:alkanesulfonate monooxygenase SsuD/methylene tetrahydromethanopterin reductase-like flavin-dependent oxidoreductase (luciferase family)
MPGPPHSTPTEIAERSRVLDDACLALGRDPATIVRSTQMIVQGDDAAEARALIGELAAAGVTHIVIASRGLYGADGVRWLVEEVVKPAKEEFGAG